MSVHRTLRLLRVLWQKGAPYLDLGECIAEVQMVIDPKASEAENVLWMVSIYSCLLH